MGGMLCCILSSKLFAGPGTDWEQHLGVITKVGGHWQDSEEWSQVGGNGQIND